MKTLVRFVFVVVSSVAAAFGGVLWLLGPEGAGAAGRRPAAPAASGPQPPYPPRLPLFSEGFFEDSGYGIAYYWTAPIKDRASLDECLEACRGRSGRGIAALEADLARISGSARSAAPGAVEAARLESFVALLHMYDGAFEKADPWLARAVATAGAPGVPPDLKANLVALRGLNALRRGEVENCVDCLGPSACIFPIDAEAVHRNPGGSRAAAGYFTEYLRRRPDDLGVRWLLNVAAMTLGEYPSGVPDEFPVPLAPFRSTATVGRFRNVAPLVGLGARGPNMAGGSVFDDFDGDDLPDVLTTTNDWEAGGSLFLNRGDGTFRDVSEASGLAAQSLSNNAAHADYDNDGRPDVVLLRGGWEHPYRLTLLHNLGGAKFEDVTLAAGLGEPIASQSATWADYDNDGLLDLFVCGEYSDVYDDVAAGVDPKRRGAVAANHCRLYHNDGGGRFTDVAASAGVRNVRWAKGSAWGDYDDDGRVDLFVSNFAGGNRLYHNDGGGRFTDVADRLGVTGPAGAFSCWFWDFDNDGRLDLFVNAQSATMQEVVGDFLGRATPGAARPRLYRNLGPEGFRDVTAAAGLDRVLVVMGSNFADVDNDGFLDVYLGTGRSPYSYLIPNVMLKNVGGRRFEDVTESSGTGHLQKGHGVSFADWDRDGDLDLFVESGGATPGDKAHNLLFQNPGRGRHWLKLKLAGTRTNRSAIGAKVRVDLPAAPGGEARSIHRTVGGNSSFGGNSLVVSVGLGDCGSAASVTVDWPSGAPSQTFEVAADRFVEITEGRSTLRAIDSTPLPDPLAAN